MTMNIEYKTEDFQTNNTVHSYIFVNGSEVGFVANDKKNKTFQFYYDNLKDRDHRVSPIFTCKKDMVAWLNEVFG